MPTVAKVNHLKTRGRVNFLQLGVHELPIFPIGQPSERRSAHSDASRASVGPAFFKRAMVGSHRTQDRNRRIGITSLAAAKSGWSAQWRPAPSIRVARLLVCHPPQLQGR
jgi:hypothetical protein